MIRLGNFLMKLSKSSSSPYTNDSIFSRPTPSSLPSTLTSSTSCRANIPRFWQPSPPDPTFSPLLLGMGPFGERGKSSQAVSGWWPCSWTCYTTTPCWSSFNNGYWGLLIYPLLVSCPTGICNKKKSFFWCFETICTIKLLDPCWHRRPVTKYMKQLR